MSWYVDTNVWAKQPKTIHLFSDKGGEQDYVPVRTCKIEPISQGSDIWKCSGCGAQWSSLEHAPRYCSNCGRRVEA